jgi:hypothetical protein
LAMHKSGLLGVRLREVSLHLQYYLYMIFYKN